MQKPTRRKDRILPEAGVLEVLKEAEYGVLSTMDEDGEPYGIPLSFVYDEGLIFFHCAYEGQKVDNLRRDDRVCFVGGWINPGHFRTLYDKISKRIGARTCENHRGGSEETSPASLMSEVLSKRHGQGRRHH